MYDSTWNYVGIWMNWFGCGHGREQMDGATLAQCAKQLALAGGEAPQISSAVSFWRKHSECEKGCTQIWLFITIRPVYTCIYPIRQTRLSLGSKQNQGDFLEPAVNTWLVCHTFFFVTKSMLLWIYPRKPPADDWPLVCQAFILLRSVRRWRGNWKAGIFCWAGLW